MSNQTQSKIASIDEQIKKLMERKNKEIEKIQKGTGKKFIEVFNLDEHSIQSIHHIIDQLEKLMVINEDGSIKLIENTKEYSTINNNGQK